MIKKINTIYYFSRFKLYWIVYTFAKKIIFIIRKNYFSLIENRKERTNDVLTFSNIIKLTIRQLITTISIAIVIKIIDPYIYDFIKVKYELLRIPDDSDYISFLVSITSLGGIFIGLYYAAISTIVSSFYATVPSNIRDLLKQERLGNVYMQFLSFITFLGLSFISLRILGFDRIFSAIPIMLIFAGIGIIAFVKLGQRAFNLFDPVILSNNIFEQLKRYTKLIRIGGFRSFDISFQHHIYKLAKNSLDTLCTLSDICSKETHLRGTPFISLSKNLLSFLVYYEEIKKYIPTDSRWFEIRYTHKDWYRTDYSQVSTAYQTASSLRPNISYDELWIEKSLIQVIKNCIEVNIQDKNYLLILELIQILEYYLKILSTNGKTKIAFFFLDDITSSVFDVLLKNEEGDYIKNESIEKIGVIERFALIPTQFAISFWDHYNIENIDKIKVKLKSINWNKKYDIYNKGFNFYFLDRLEWLQERLSFELNVDNKIVSPMWYQEELLLQILAENFKENTDILIHKITDLFTSWIEKTKESKHVWFLGAILSREWEFIHKIEYQIDSLNNYWESIIKNRRIEGMQWADFDIKKFQKQCTKTKKDLLFEMSQQNLLLEYIKRNDQYPDYAGQFLHTTGEECVNALLNNDVTLLDTIFYKYLIGCIMRFENLRPKDKLEAWRLNIELKISSAPLLDLMDLSGYARLLADYHNNERLWEIIKLAWDQYIEQQTNNPLPVFINSLIIIDNGLEIPHRGILRTNWKINIGKKISDVPKHNEHRHSIIGYHTVIDHKSPLIRLFSKGELGSMYDGIDIFSFYYLKNNCDDFDENKIGWRRHQFVKSLEREMNQNKEDNDDE